MQKLKGIQLVIASGSEVNQDCLQKLFAKHGADVVLCGFLNFKFIEQLEHNISADVILVDMDDSYEDDDDALDLLLEKIDLPILFHDNAFDELNDQNDDHCFATPALEKLVTKLAELVADKVVTHEMHDEVVVEDNPPATSLNNNEDPDQVIEPPETICAQESQIIEQNIPPVDEVLGIDEGLIAGRLLDDKELSASVVSTVNIGLSAAPAEILENEISDDITNVWVLGASIGGPDAVKRFLARIPKELPVAFVLAQHLGDGFVSLLATQLDRVSSFYVKEGVSGDTLSHGEVVVVPVDNKMSLNEKGEIKFIEGDWKGHYKPSIDDVIEDVTNRFKKQSGVIIFSGMGADGVLASQQFFDQHNGIIWAQSTDSCVISSMPDSVRKANLVSYSGSPEALALKISVQYMGKDSYIV